MLGIFVAARVRQPHRFPVARIQHRSEYSVPRPEKFIKAFFRAEDGDEGCNVKVFQNALAETEQPRMRAGKVDAFAFYPPITSSDHP